MMSVIDSALVAIKRKVAQMMSAGSIHFCK